MVALLLAHKCRMSLSHVLRVFRSVACEGEAAVVSCWKQKGVGGGELKLFVTKSHKQWEVFKSSLLSPVFVPLLESGEKYIGPWSKRTRCILYNPQTRKERGEQQINMEMITLQRLISFQVQMKRISYPISLGTCIALKRCIYTVVRIGTDSQVSTGTSFILCLGSEGKTAFQSQCLFATLS